MKKRIYIKNIDNNKKGIALNFEEIIRRQKLENDLAFEINKDELTGRENLEKNNNSSKNKFIGINRHYTSFNISNKQNYIANNKRPKIQIKKFNNETLNIKQNKIDNNSKDVNLFLNRNNDLTTYSSTNISNSNISNNFYANPKNKQYEQMKTYKNQINSIDNYNKKNSYNTYISSKNIINNIYAPKKCHKVSKGKTKIKEFSSSLFSPEVSYSKNISNKKNKSPEALSIYNEKITYIKKNLSNFSANKIEQLRLNNSLGNINCTVNKNFNINKTIKNKMTNEIDCLEIKHNLNSSFQTQMNLEKNKINNIYNTANIGNIFNQEDDNNNYNKTNINFNLNPSFNSKYSKNNLSKSFKTNNSDYGFNTFYQNNNNNKINNSFLNKNIYISNNQKYINNDNNYSTKNYNKNIILKNRQNNISTIYKYKNENKSFWKKKYDNNDFNSTNAFAQLNNSNLYQKNQLDSLKYEDLLILEDKLMNIMISLNNEKLISNECFEYWNYFYNCSLYENINIIISNLDLDNQELVKLSLNYNLMSIMLSYDTSFENQKLDKIRPLLLEMLELCHKLLIITYEFILNIVNNNNNNLWIKKLYHLINSSKLSDGTDTLFLESTKISEKEKMKYNINYLMQKIHFILYNYPSTFSQSYLMSLFKKINNKTYDDINDFFLEYIFRDKDVKYSILASTFLKSGEVITPRPYPYLNYNSHKKYTLIIDIDETLFHFKINEDDDEQGVLKIRPGVFQFIDEIKEYYEIILFSEAEKSYIDLITDAVGDDRYLYDCILCRDYITIIGQNFIKDLRKIGRPLDKIIIIDNMPQNFSYNKENGIYIKSFWGEENDDKALIDLIPILVNIARSGKDVRKELVKYKEKIVTKISSNLFKNNNL